MKENSSRKRHITKAITWRVVGTTDTTLLAWFFTGNPLTGLKIGFTEVVTKTLLYYLHERAWFGVDRRNMKWLQNSRWRHLIKTFSWRFIGTTDTMILAWIISGDPLTGFHIGGAELITKTILYYVHERIWYKSKFGLTQAEFDLDHKEDTASGPAT